MKISWDKLKQYFIYAIMGGMLAVAFPPFFIFPIFFISFGWLYSNTTKGSDTFLKIFTYFTSFFIALLYWLVNPLTFDLKTYAILIPFALVVAPMFLGIQFAAAVWLWSKCFHRNAIMRISGFSCTLCGLIYFCGEIFPNFPWMLPAYICCGHEIFMQPLAIFGVYGLSFFMLLISTFFGEIFISHSKNDKQNVCIYSLIITLTTTAWLGFGHFRLQKNPTYYTKYSAYLVQGNISQENKENRALARNNLQQYIWLTLHENDVDFVIWPEASVPYLYHENFEELHNLLVKHLHNNEILITGVVRHDLKNSLIYNSIIAMNKQKRNIATYDKSKLVPFGEYVPCRQLLEVSPLAAEIDDFAVGTSPKIFNIKGLNILFLNCYEIAFRQKKENADLLINLTNDGWFGHTTELFQHLAIARVRAVELGIPVIRVTNFGISAVFDPCGRCIAEIGVNKTKGIYIKIPEKLD